MDTLEILTGRGHLTLTWDPELPEDVARARVEVERLRAAAYQFFLVEGGPADPVAAGRGTLEVRRINDPTAADEIAVAVTTRHPGEPLIAPAGETPTETEPKRRGGRRSVAARQMGGGSR